MNTRGSEDTGAYGQDRAAGSSDSTTSPTNRWPDLIVIMGVSGSGKSTMGAALAQALGHVFADADDFHPPANVEKMRSGQALNDEDRAPWLDALNQLLVRQRQAGQPIVLACSALRQRYRDRLGHGLADLCWVHLSGSIELIAARMASRQHRYMPASLLRSQFETLEPPIDAIEVSIDSPPDQLVAEITRRISSSTSRSRSLPK